MNTQQPHPATDVPVTAVLHTQLDGQRFATVLADPPWRFSNRTGKLAPEHQRLRRYNTLSMDAIAALNVAAAGPVHHTDRDRNPDNILSNATTDTADDGAWLQAELDKTFAW